ncbi:MAG: HEAT repeat domain-containing protein [Gammaproteobacteria bacterium]|nr:HEAT repeat domain-containing protein [Gammaproteobacteria bacterium]
MSKSKNKSLFVTWLAIMLASAALADVDRSIAGLSDRDWQVRRAAAESLGASGSTDKAVVGVLTTALKDPDSRVRRSAADALGHIGEKARTAIPALVEAFDDMDPSVVAAAARAAGQMGTRASKATGNLTALLDHDDARVRAAASASLGNLGRRAAKSAFDLNGRLSDPDPAVRAAAAVSLGQLGPRSKASVTDLIRVLGDDDDSVRDAASGALVRMGKKAVPNLVRALQNGNPIFLQAVVDTLGRIGPAAAPRLSEALLEDQAPDIARGYAAMALAQIANRDDSVIATLTTALEDQSVNVRMSAAEALGHAGALAQPASAKLIEISIDSRESVLVREFAISALAKIAPGDAAVEEALIYAVSDGNPRIYDAAVNALLRIRRWHEGAPDIDSRVAQLIRELESGSAGAAEALGLIGDEAKAAVPSLIAALENTDPEMRAAALVALERIGPQTQTIPALVQAMRSGDLASRGAAAARLESYARSRIDVWKPLLLQSDAPILRNWLARHEALYGLRPDEDLQTARSEAVRQASYLDVMGGRAAIRESMQLELISNPVAGQNETATTSVDDVSEVRVSSHPFDDMLKDSEAPITRVELAEFVPDDRFFAWFRDVGALREVLDGAVGQFMRFESSLAVKSIEYKLGERYGERLGLSGIVLDQIEALNAIAEFTIVSRDLFFIDGADISIVARLTSPTLTRSVLDVLGLDVPADGIVETHTTNNGNDLYWTLRGDVLLLGTSRYEIDRMLALSPKRDKGSLGNSSEFLYMQQQLAIGDTTQAYLYFSDPFIRHLVSPEVKIAQLRRVQARAEMEILVAGAMLYLLDGHRNVPSKQQLINRGYLPRYFEDRDYTLGEDLIVSSPTWGTIAKMKPLDEAGIVAITKTEADTYNRFVQNYTRYWRQFFDPIAIRLDAAGNNNYEMQSFILPLLDSRIYNEVKDALVTRETGQDLRIPSVTPVPSMMFSMNLNDDLRVELSQEIADLLVEYTSVDPEVFDSIGSGMHLAVQDSTPIVALGGGDIWGAFSKEMLNLEGFASFLPIMASLATQPSTLLIELADPDTVHQFLSDAVVKRAEVGGSGELHKLQDREAWIYTLNVEDIVQIHLRLEIQGNYLAVSNLPWTTAVTIGRGQEVPLNGAQLTLDLTRISEQLPALHTKVYTDYRAAAVDGMGYLYPLLEAGIADSVDQAIRKHFEIFGLMPVHPANGEWIWRDSYLESSQFGTATRPVQPEWKAGDRRFGLFPQVDLIGVNMQLEDTGLRATIRWATAE